VRSNQLTGRWKRLRPCGTARIAVATLAVVVIGLTPTAGRAQLVTLYAQNFDGIPWLGPAMDENPNPPGYTGPSNVVTLTPPSGWFNNVTGVPGNGVREWKGWSFTRYDWWWRVAGDQNRSQFTRAQGNVMVADPDEYDDLGGGPIANGPPWYNAFATTQAFSLVNANGGSAVTLRFDSSWRPEGFDDGDRTNNQTAIVRATFSRPDFPNTVTEVLRWDSQPSSPFFHPDATNEAVTRSIPLPVGANTMWLEFGLTNAGNDWWWAIDNITVTVPEPSSLALAGSAALGCAGGWLRRRGLSPTRQRGLSQPVPSLGRRALE
jgi:hypothetical protein